MINTKLMGRKGKCRGCRKEIPSGAKAFYVNTNTEVAHICEDCIYDLISEVARDFDTFNDLGEHIVMRKLSTK